MLLKSGILHHRKTYHVEALVMIIWEKLHIFKHIANNKLIGEQKYEQI